MYYKNQRNTVLQVFRERLFFIYFICRSMSTQSLRFSSLMTVNARRRILYQLLRENYLHLFSCPFVLLTAHILTSSLLLEPNSSSYCGRMDGTNTASAPPTTSPTTSSPSSSPPLPSLTPSISIMSL